MQRSLELLSIWFAVDSEIEGRYFVGQPDLLALQFYDLHKIDEGIFCVGATIANPVVANGNQLDGYLSIANLGDDFLDIEFFFVATCFENCVQLFFVLDELRFCKYFRVIFLSYGDV